MVKSGVRDLNVLLLLLTFWFLKIRHRQGSGFRVGIDQNTAVTPFTGKSYCRGSQTFLVRGTLFRYAKYSGTSLM